MGRELRRKQAKKEGKSLQPEIKEEEKLIKKLLIITAILVFIICTIYIISALFKFVSIIILSLIPQQKYAKNVIFC